MKKQISLLVLSMLAADALAQDAVEEDARPELRRYTVEMIIFSYARNVAAGSETFAPDLPPVEDLLFEDDLRDGIGDGLSNATQEPLPEAPVDEELAVGDDRQYELVMLAEEDFGLVELHEHLDRLEAYEPLIHFGWTQRTYAGEEVEARPLSSFITPPDELQGELTLYLSRYLHLAVKLQLDAPVAEEREEVTALDRFNASYDVFSEAAPVSYPVRYRIEEDRIFRIGELRYYDHPKFGVLAKVTRVEEEDPVEDELLEETELLGYGVE